MANQDSDEEPPDHLDLEDDQEPGFWDLNAFYDEERAATLTPAIFRMINLPPPPDENDHEAETTPEKVARLTREILFGVEMTPRSALEELMAAHFEDGYRRRIRADGRFYGRFKYWRDALGSRNEDNYGATRITVLILRIFWLELSPADGGKR